MLTVIKLKIKSYSNKHLHLKRRKVVIKQPNFTFWGSRKEEKTKPQISRRKKKNKTEINQIGNGQTIEKK